MTEQFGDRYPDLLHGIALTDSDRGILEGVEVDGDAEGRPELVLTPIATADRLGLIEIAHEMGLQQPQHLTGQRHEVVLLREGKHRHLVGREAGMEPQHSAGLAPHLLLVVGG